MANSSARSEVPATTDDLVGIVLRNLKDGPARNYRRELRLFARFRGAATADEALRELIGLGPDEARRLLEDFRAKMEADGLTASRVAGVVTALRTAVRKLRAAGKTDLDLDVPRVPYAPDGLVAIALRGLSPLTRERHLRAYEAFARSRGVATLDDALQELIGLGREGANRLLGEFRAKTEARGRAPLTGERAVTALRTAVRKLRAAGKTALSLDGRPGPQVAPYAPDGLVAIALRDLIPRTRKAHFMAYRAFARFRATATADDALQELLGLGSEEAERLLDDFQARELTRGRSTSVASARVTALRTGVRKLRAAGKTDLDLDRRHGPIPREPYDPAGLVGATLQKLSSKTARGYIPGYEAFARFRETASADDALQELIGLGREGANRLLGEFRAAMRADGFTPRRMARAVAAIRTAVRKLRAAGKTDLDLDESPKTGSKLPAVPDVTERPWHERPWCELVVLGGPKDPPVVLDNRHKKPLNSKQYRVIKALLEAGASGLSGVALRKKSGCGGAHKILKRLFDSDTDWATVIKFPGTCKGGGYRIGFPST